MTSDFILGKPFKGITVLLETRVLVPDPDDPEPKQTKCEMQISYAGYAPFVSFCGKGFSV
jgi:hypothetical protein